MIPDHGKLRQGSLKRATGQKEGIVTEEVSFRGKNQQTGRDRESIDGVWMWIMGLGGTH